MLVTPESSPRGSWIAKIFGPAKPLLLRVGDRQPVQQALVVSQRQRLRLVSRPFCSLVLTSCSRYNDRAPNIVPHITKTGTALLVVAYPHVLFTELRGIGLLLGRSYARSRIPSASNLYGAVKISPIQPRSPGPSEAGRGYSALELSSSIHRPVL